MITRWIPKKPLGVLKGVSSMFYSQTFKKANGNAMLTMIWPYRPTDIPGCFS